MSSEGWKLPLLAAAASLLLLSACRDGDRGGGADKAVPVELRVMTFNIEWGGTNVSFDNVVEAIRLANPDIVGIQEAEGNLQRLAAELGWNYDLQNYAISRYPILDPPNASRLFVYVEVRPGQVVALANVHLPSDPSGTELVRDGGSREAVIALENSVRVEPLLAYLDVLAPVVESNTPVFLTGDFNAPSHTDWTEAMVGTRPFLRFAVEWPVSRRVENAGFKDSWRTAHPDPRTHPGLTWWAGRPPLEEYSPGENDPQDRIDFIWFTGPASVLSSELIGEPGAKNVTISVSPWPSDHRAVLSAFTVHPATTPRLVSTKQRIFGLQDNVVVSYRHAENSSIEITGHGSSTVSGDGELQFPAGTFTAGKYEIEMRTPGFASIHSNFWVMDENANPSVSVAHDEYRVGEAIDIDWQNGPGNRNDYLGIYEVGIDAAYMPGYDGGLTWLYVNALPEGSVRLDAASSEVLWPLPQGTYVVRLLKDDGYEVLAESMPFEVR